MLIASLLWLTVGATTAAPAEDSWYRVRVNVPNIVTLDRLQNSDLDLMECIPHLGTTDVAVGPGEFAKLDKGKYEYQIVSKLEDPRNWGATHAGSYANSVDEYRLHYFTADQILAFYETLRAQHPAVVSRQSIGTTINGETMWAYKFNPAVSGHGTPNNIVIQSLIHAREWITGASVMHIAKMITDRLSSPIASRFMQGQAVWIIPMANPDGYRYTWTGTRLWRKNRRQNSGGSFGVDINRNYSKGWGLNGGSSSTQNSETYRGTAAFSEPEAVAVRDFVASLPRVGGFIDYHSYAQLVLEPWGYTTTAAPDAVMLDDVAAQINTEMNNFGATYQHGQTSQILYIASGTSNDFVYDVRRKPAFGIELRDTGQFGFELPEDQIFITQEEVWAGFQKFVSIVGP